MPETYTLTVPDDDRRRLATGWLWLGLLALAGSGVFALLIVLSRMPYVSQVFPYTDFFHTALVVHVDLSVLVWFLAFAGILFSLNSNPRHAGLGWTALIVAAAGTGIITVSPFAAPGAALMSNYIPVLAQPVFLAGLVVLALGFGLMVLKALIGAERVGMAATGAGALRFGLNTAAVAAAMAAMAFLISYIRLPVFMESKEYYEVLFWGGGHLMQNLDTQLMLVVWLWLASASGLAPKIPPRVVLMLFGWGLLAVFITPAIYLAYDVGSAEYRRLFTWQMAFGGSLAAAPIGLAIALGGLTARNLPAAQRGERAALLWSMVLFGAGGVLGFLINGSNVTVPAHYHGCIVGITLAFMGLTYHLLPRLGFAQVSPKAASVQAHLYGVGQFLHISGLAWAGANGIQRKTAGAAQGLDSVERIVAMGLMGVGGLITIVAGVIFLVLAFRAFRGSKTGSVRLHASA